MTCLVLNTPILRSMLHVAMEPMRTQHFLLIDWFRLLQLNNWLLTIEEHYLLIDQYNRYTHLYSPVADICFAPGNIGTFNASKRSTRLCGISILLPRGSGSRMGLSSLARKNINNWVRGTISQGHLLQFPTPKRETFRHVNVG